MGCLYFGCRLCVVVRQGKTEPSKSVGSRVLASKDVKMSVCRDSIVLRFLILPLSINQPPVERPGICCTSSSSTTSSFTFDAPLDNDEIQLSGIDLICRFAPGKQP